MWSFADGRIAARIGRSGTQRSLLRRFVSATGATRTRVPHQAVCGIRCLINETRQTDRARQRKGQTADTGQCDVSPGVAAMSIDRRKKCKRSIVEKEDPGCAKCRDQHRKSQLVVNKANFAVVRALRNPVANRKNRMPPPSKEPNEAAATSNSGRFSRLCCERRADIKEAGQQQSSSHHPIGVGSRCI